MAVYAKCTSVKDKWDRRNHFLFSHIMAVGEGRNSGKILDAEWLAKQVGAPVLWPYADCFVCYITDMEFVYSEFDESTLAMKLYRAWRRWQGRGRNILDTLEAQKIAYFHAVAGDADVVREIVFTE
jgi:nicotinamide riboside kinase